jgi:hypothetical protein
MPAGLGIVGVASSSTSRRCWRGVPIEWWMGDSRGRWEDDTLVVSVTHFNDQTWFESRRQLP